MKLYILIILTVIGIAGTDGYINGLFSQKEQTESARLHKLLVEHKFDEAVEGLDKFLTKFPFNEQAYADLAAAEIGRGHPERAQALLITTRTLTFSPRVKQAFFKNWYIARDTLVVALICELLYCAYKVVGKHRWLFSSNS